MKIKNFMLIRGIGLQLYLLLTSLILLASHGGNTSAAVAAPQAHLIGEFGPLHTWPIIPIAMMLMPDGRLFAYGTTPSGVQDAKMQDGYFCPSPRKGKS